MPPAVEIGLSGLLELTSGCSRLPQLEAAGLRYCMASGFLAFGGLCVWLQTKSVIAPYGLTGRHYLAGKVIQGTIAVLLTWGIQVLFPAGSPRSLPAAAFPNHTGLLRATAIVTALFFMCHGDLVLAAAKKGWKRRSPRCIITKRMMWEETYMLFRKKIPGSCQYCAHGVRLEGGQIVCVKKDFWRETAPAAASTTTP